MDCGGIICLRKVRCLNISIQCYSKEDVFAKTSSALKDITFYKITSVLANVNIESLASENISIAEQAICTIRLWTCSLTGSTM